MRTFLKFLLFSVLLPSCSASNSSVIHRYEYSDVVDKQITYLEVFEQSENYYFIYYYQIDCYHCHGIKSKIINYALETSYPFYFIEIDKDYGFLSRTKEDTIGTNDPLKAFSMMTPQLSIVENGYIKETYIGVEEIFIIIE